MTDALGNTALKRWRRDPCSFIAETMNDPETGQPFDLLPAERVFFEHAFKTDASGRLLFPEQVFSAPKKSGKTTVAALHMLTTTLIFGGAYAEGYCVANDLEQAQGRVFQALKRIVECSPLLRAEAKVLSDRIDFSTGATISAIASDYAGAAGANPCVSAFDELWAFTSERSRRLWDEMVPPPTRKIACRLTTTYAGFENESVLLEELYRRGLAQPQIEGFPLYAGGGLLMFWSHVPIAPWQTPEWLDQMRGQLRPNAFARMIENRFANSTSTFIDMEWFDACVDPNARPVVADNQLPVWIGVDASLKRDSTAIVAVTWDREANRVRLVNHRIFQPTASDPLNFEATVEHTLRDLCSRFSVRSIHFDPWQMASVAQRLRSAGLPMCEFPQSVPNLTVIGSNLYELIKGQNLVAYPDDAIRLAISRTVAKETARGFQLTKDKASHKIDVVIALAMAARTAVEQGQNELPLDPGIYEHIGVFSASRLGAPGSYSVEDAAHAYLSRGSFRSNGGSVIW